MAKSFTLIELIVVIAIIAILAAIIAPNAFRAIEKAKIVKVETDAKTIKKAALAYYADTGKFPTDSGWLPTANDEIEIFITGENQPTDWDGPYLDKWPAPPWQCPFSLGGNLISGTYDWDHWDAGHPYSGGEETCAVSSSCIPQSVAEKIEQHLDDGDFLTGKVTWRDDYAEGFLTMIIIGGGTGI